MSLAIEPVAASRTDAPAAPAEAVHASGLPQSIIDANRFALWNALSWQISISSPVWLYAKTEGANATLLGIITALLPLMVIFQIPAAHYLPRFGYRKFMLAGWGTRNFFIFAMAFIPLLAVSSAWKLTLLVTCLTGFNFVRGVTSGAWLPWITEIIPEQWRGRFLSRDQLFCGIGCLGALVISAIALGGDRPLPWQFMLVFLVSGIAQTVSLIYLKRMPDVTAPEKLRASGHRVPWKEMLFYRPFFRLLVLNLFWCAVWGGLPVFVVAFLKVVVGYSESHILGLSIFQIVGVMIAGYCVGRVIDRTGNRLALGGAMAMMVAVSTGWWLLGSRLAGIGQVTVAGLYLAMGLMNVTFNVSNTRQMMDCMPLMGRNHFFALFTVITNLCLGLAPILWGVMLDTIGGWQRTAGPVSWNRYSVYFALMAGLATAGLAWIGQLRDRPRLPAREQRLPSAEV